MYQYEDVLLGKCHDAGPTLAQLNNVPVDLDDTSMLEDINSIISSEMLTNMTGLKLESFTQPPQSVACLSGVSQPAANFTKPHTVSVNPENYLSHQPPQQQQQPQQHQPQQRSVLAAALSSPQDLTTSLLRHVLEQDSDGHLLSSAKSAIRSAQAAPMTVFQDSTRTYYNLLSGQCLQPDAPNPSDMRMNNLQEMTSQARVATAAGSVLPQALDWSYSGELQTVDPASLLKLLKSPDPVLPPPTVAAAPSAKTSHNKPPSHDRLRQQAMAARLTRLRGPRRTRGVSEGTGMMALEEQEQVARALANNRAVKRALADDDDTDVDDIMTADSARRTNTSFNTKWEEIRRYLEASPSPNVASFGASAAHQQQLRSTSNTTASGGSGAGASSLPRNAPKKLKSSDATGGKH